MANSDAAVAAATVTRFLAANDSALNVLLVAFGQDVFAALGLAHDIFEKLVDSHDLDSEFGPHQVHKGVVLLSGSSGPNHVVEQKL